MRQGWYPNPTDPAEELFWDGNGWNGRRAAGVSAAGVSTVRPPHPRRAFWIAVAAVALVVGGVWAGVAVSNALMEQPSARAMSPSPSAPVQDVAVDRSTNWDDVYRDQGYTIMDPGNIFTKIETTGPYACKTENCATVRVHVERGCSSSLHLEITQMQSFTVVNMITKTYGRIEPKADLSLDYSIADGTFLKVTKVSCL